MPNEKRMEEFPLVSPATNMAIEAVTVNIPAKTFDLLGLSRELRDLVYDSMVEDAENEDSKCDETCCLRTFEMEYGMKEEGQAYLSHEEDKFSCLQRKRHFTYPLTISRFRHLMPFTNRQVHEEYLAALFRQSSLTISVIPSNVGLFDQEDEWSLMQPYTQQCDIIVNITEDDVYHTSPAIFKLLVSMPRLRSIYIRFNVHCGSNSSSKNYQNDGILEELAKIASSLDSLESLIYERDLGNDELAILSLLPVLETDEKLARCEEHAKLHQHVKWRQGYGWFKQVAYVRGPCDWHEWGPVDDTFRRIESLCDVRKSCWAEIPRQGVTMDMLKIGADCGNEDFEAEEHGHCDTDDCGKHWGLE